MSKLETSSPAPLSQGQRLAINNLYRAFNTGDADLLGSVLVDDWEDFPPAPGQGPGRAGVGPTIKAFHAAFADVAFAVQEVIGSDGSAAVRLTLSGRHIGDWMGVKASGVSFKIAMHELHHFEGEFIAKTWHVEDWAAWRKQVTS